MPAVPDDAPVDDDIAAMYETAARRRAARAARRDRRGRPWWPPIAAVLGGLVLVGGLAAGGAAVARAGLRIPPKAPPENGHSTPGWATLFPGIAEAAETSASVDASASAETTAAAEESATLEPTSTAVADYALPYPDSPEVESVVIKKLHPEHKYVAITIDDGIPFDTRILQLFEQNGFRATTFVLGTFAEQHPELLERMKADGFEIANHSWNHADLRRYSEAGLRGDLTKAQDEISAVTGNQAPYLRPPGGGHNERVRRIAASMGYRIVMWNRSLADTSNSATPYQLYKNAVHGLEPGDIILCHWGRPYTYDAMRSILPELKRRGFTAVTLSELIEDSGGIEALGQDDSSQAQAD